MSVPVNKLRRFGALRLIAAIYRWFGWWFLLSSFLSTPFFYWSSLSFAKSTLLAGFVTMLYFTALLFLGLLVLAVSQLIDVWTEIADNTRLMAEKS